MLNRRLLIAFAGPWGLERKLVWIKCRIQFPDGYPDTAIPSFSLEDSASLSHERKEDMLNEVSKISKAYHERQLSSLEAIIRNLVGERSLEESLLLLTTRPSIDLERIQASAQSSSDEDDEDPQIHPLYGSQETLEIANAQYNVPLPKACGALWANDGRLICFFPHKEEKTQPIPGNHSLKASEDTTKNYKAVFESFGYFGRRSQRGALQRSRSGPADSDSDDSGYSESSSASSSSLEDMNLTSQMFLPSIGFAEARLEKHSEVALEESQWSSADVGNEKSISSKLNYVSLHSCQYLLPSRLDLASAYALSADTHNCCTHNARVAEEANLHELAEIWSLVDLLVHSELPQEVIPKFRHIRSAYAIARHAIPPLRSKDSAIDMSFDILREESVSGKFSNLNWGQHPFGQQGLVEEL